MAELTKTDNRQPMGKIKPTDKMVMMLSLFDGTKPATSKQHYERFNLYINFQTESGHLTDPVREAIDLFEHTLDKTALVWFQMNRSEFKDLTTLSWGDRSDTDHSKCLLLGGRRLNLLTVIPKPKGSGGARAATAQIGPANERNKTK